MHTDLNQQKMINTHMLQLQPDVILKFNEY